MDEQNIKLLVKSLLEQIKSRFNTIDGYLQNKPNLLLDSKFRNKLASLEQAVDDLSKFL